MIAWCSAAMTSRALKSRSPLAGSAATGSGSSSWGSCATATWARPMRWSDERGDGQVVRRWIAPDSPLVYAVPWAVVKTQFTFPGGGDPGDPAGRPVPVAEHADADASMAGMTVSWLTMRRWARWRHVPNPGDVPGAGLLLVRRHGGGTPASSTGSRSDRPIRPATCPPGPTTRSAGRSGRPGAAAPLSGRGGVPLAEGEGCNVVKRVGRSWA